MYNASFDGWVHINKINWKPTQNCTKINGKSSARNKSIRLKKKKEGQRDFRSRPN